MQKTFQLPTPDETAARHSAELTALIRETIASRGDWISFARFMDLALYAPGLGYYSAGATRFGPAGDFVTAPELSPVFARCVAHSIAPWLRTNSGADILELGAGSGVFAVDLLRALDALESLPRRYRILEVSADLRRHQCERVQAELPDLASRIEWLDGPPDRAFDGVVIGNEVIDALPAERFRVRNGSIENLGVTWTDAGFDWLGVPADESLADAVRALREDQPQAWPDGFVSELRPALPAWLTAVTQSLRRGLAVFIDYGLPAREYYRADRPTGTLRCHYRHRAHDDPFRWPGLQDITVWVDFTALAQAADAAGLDVAAFTTQAHFLLGAGVENLVTDEATAMQRAQQSASLQTLMLPGGMGERFKVMVLARDAAWCPTNAAMRDMRHRL